MTLRSKKRSKRVVHPNIERGDQALAGHPRSPETYSVGRCVVGTHLCGKVCVFTPVQVDEWRHSSRIPNCRSHDHIPRREALKLTEEYLFSERRGRRTYHYYTAYWLTRSHVPAAIYFNSAPRTLRKASSGGYMVLQLVADSKRRR